jgi:hypothetical protein
MGLLGLRASNNAIGPIWKAGTTLRLDIYRKRTMGSFRAH